MKVEMAKHFRIFLRIVNNQEMKIIDKNILDELRNWGREKTLGNIKILEEYIKYKNVLNDYSNILQEKKENENEQIEKVANYVGLTTNYSKKKINK
ncbi:conserved Plasmodium protein, unknown function [Plasmodium berghei]|uniref:Uncharacterized protein n=2 Tax=Plasmodium berghei TaxID=5821 RepID=A0A509AWH0_PLABA|nr:conserved Plasmodium protein, unknown function [Plasmodium berghei ANKA]CXJ29133.1 conserved Plasmodium protein, unknown function [Plasmodium berghei]SCM27072.1 conserved Plasmodium protein, unknown function [Plasmodium berghei]SCN28798.1 conserved Plasmodium protein, unknown function [Plasmodium berghei]SCO63089.1 conserved Plasmodium protein, unknown function [Plasmodium berghei]SCO64545.1 conserved Plasmodium protein, unknown function [Plasmodium berghei]|eukprot:XP_034424444.1 conserved Plasmodium protein, unknown function [Plasmodium berghei ANKA]